MDELTSNKLVINHHSKVEMRSAAGWAKFLAIVGFIFSGLIILFGLILVPVVAGFNTSDTATPLTATSATVLIVFYLLMGLLYFLPNFFMFRFAKMTEEALKDNSAVELADAFANLKRTFKFVGILTIVGLAFYLLVIVGAALVASLGMLPG